MTKLMATLPDGRVVTRTTERDYRHVVCSARADQKTWDVYRWTMKDGPAALQPIVAEACREGNLHVTVVPVTKVQKRIVKAPRWQARPGQMHRDVCTRCGRACSRHSSLCQFCQPKIEG